MIDQKFAYKAFQNIRPTMVRDGKKYILLTRVYTHADKNKIKKELQRKNIIHRIEPIRREEKVLGWSIWIL